MLYFFLNILFIFIAITPKMASDMMLELNLDSPFILSTKITGISTILKTF